MKAKVIGGSIDGVDNLAPVLFDFDPRGVLDEYGEDWEKVLNRIEEEIRPRGQIRRATLSIWPQYCKTILSAARFIEQFKFKTAEDFYEWVKFFDRDERVRPSLPMLLEHEIEGFGFALSCDLLKELGYTSFPKPDVHLRDIFTALRLSEKGAERYQLFKDITRVANHSDVTPYNVDKVFWLIGSGNFYRDIDMIGKKGVTIQPP